MKKKFVVAFMAMALALSAVACGEKAPITPATQESTTEESVSAPETADEETSEEATTEESADAADEASSEEGSQSDLVSADFSSGVIKDNAYVNEFFNVKCPVDDDMQFVDEATLEKLSGMAIDMTDNEAYKKEFESGKTVMVAYAGDANNTKNLTIAISSTGILTTAVLSEEQYFKLSAPSVVQQLESMGLSNIKDSTETVKFAGEDHVGLTVTGEANGITITEKSVALIKDGYIIVFGYTGLDENDINGMMEKSCKLN